MVGKKYYKNLINRLNMLIIGIKRLNMYYSKEMIIYITQSQFDKNGSGMLKICTQIQTLTKTSI